MFYGGMKIFLKMSVPELDIGAEEDRRHRIPQQATEYSLNNKL